MTMSFAPIASALVTIFLPISSVRSLIPVLSSGEVQQTSSSPMQLILTPARARMVAPAAGMCCIL